MPDDRRFRALSLAGILGSLPAAMIALASRAYAAPTPTPSPSTSDNPCDLIVGLAKDYCEDGEGAARNARNAPTVTDDALDPSPPSPEAAPTPPPTSSAS